MPRIVTQVRPAPYRHRASLLDWLLARVALLHQRRQLAQLEPHMLEDIGVTEGEAQTEAKRPFWDAPQHWHL